MVSFILFLELSGRLMPSTKEEASRPLAKSVPLTWLNIETYGACPVSKTNVASKLHLSWWIAMFNLTLVGLTFPPFRERSDLLRTCLLL
jgi:hypothetical protein